jgi:hypothetical protein
MLNVPKAISLPRTPRVLKIMRKRQSVGPSMRNGRRPGVQNLAITLVRLMDIIV